MGKKILFVKLSAIGDVIHCLPALESIKACLPSARISWVVEEKASNLLEDYPNIEKLYIFKRKSWLCRLKNPLNMPGVLKEFISFIKEIRREKFDIVMDYQGLLKSGIITFLSGGRRKIGFKDAREFSYIFLDEKIDAPPRKEIHALVRNFYLVKSLGINSINARWNFPLKEEEEKVFQKLKSLGLNLTKPFILIHPFAGWKTKLWSQDKFALLGNRIVEELGANTLFTGGKEDISYVQGIIYRMTRGGFNLAGKTSLKELAGLCRKCRAFISTDTGPMHLASAVEVPVIALFGPTAPWRTGPYGNKSIIIRKEMQCSPCFKKECDSRECMDFITVEEVFQKVKEIFDGSSF